MQGLVAGAPISRGVCEVPGWAYQLRLRGLFGGQQ
jgi:hypothetical protein